MLLSKSNKLVVVDWLIMGLERQAGGPYSISQVPQLYIGCYPFKDPVTRLTQVLDTTRSWHIISLKLSSKSSNLSIFLCYDSK